MYHLDSAHVWHVAKTGNDVNSGHAQQYPVAFAADAKLTISATITAAAAGDTIIVWPGAYDENVDVSKQLAIIGSGPKSSVVSVSSGPAIRITAHGVRLKGLGGITSDAGKNGIETGNANIDLVIEDCYGESDFWGIMADAAHNLRLLNSHGKGGAVGIKVWDTDKALVDGCIAETTGGYTAYPTTRGFLIDDCEGLIIRNTNVFARRALNGDNYHLAGVEVDGGGSILENVNIYVDHSGTGDNHTTYGIKSVSGQVNVRGCLLKGIRIAGNYTGYHNSAANICMISDTLFYLPYAPTSDVYRIYNSGGEVIISNANNNLAILGVGDYGTIKYVKADTVSSVAARL